MWKEIKRLERIERYRQNLLLIESLNNDKHITKENVYIDGKGYIRFKLNDELCHRNIAYNKIYLPNKKKYKLDFSKYVVHHKDSNKLNDNVENLQIMTKKQHMILHKHLIMLNGKVYQIICNENDIGIKNKGRFTEYNNIMYESKYIFKKYGNLYVIRWYYQKLHNKTKNR